MITGLDYKALPRFCDCEVKQLHPLHLLQACNTIIHLTFTQPGKILLVQPCTILAIFATFRSPSLPPPQFRRPLISESARPSDIGNRSMSLRPPALPYWIALINLSRYLPWLTNLDYFLASGTGNCVWEMGVPSGLTCSFATSYSSSSPQRHVPVGQEQSGMGPEERARRECE